MPWTLFVALTFYYFPQKRLTVLNRVTRRDVFIQWKVVDFVDWDLANLCHCVSIYMFPIISCLFWFKFESGFLSNHFLMTALSGFLLVLLMPESQPPPLSFALSATFNSYGFLKTSAFVSHHCFKLRTVNVSLHEDPSLPAAPMSANGIMITRPGLPFPPPLCWVVHLVLSLL